MLRSAAADHELEKVEELRALPQAIFDRIALVEEDARGAQMRLLPSILKSWARGSCDEIQPEATNCSLPT